MSGSKVVTGHDPADACLRLCPAGKPALLAGLDESSAHLLDEPGLLEGLAAISPSRTSPRSSAGSGENGERYSRKVFVGGLPPDIDEGEDAGKGREDRRGRGGRGR